MSQKHFVRFCALVMALLHTFAHAAQPAASSVVAGHIAFVSGQVTVQNPRQTPRTLQNGAPVYVGDQIQTQNDSYLHLRMVDNAFVALRPVSQLTIEAYDFNPSQPEASRIRLDLQHGTSRAVSGKGGQAAKHQYRFNTPLAAIGLRGTDYTVVADTDKTRVSVSQGGVIVSPFGADCYSNQLGPCLTALSRELTAAMPVAYLEVTGNQAPGVHMAAAAPRPALSGTDGLVKETLLLGVVDRNTPLPAPTPTPVPPQPEPVQPDVGPQPGNTTALARWGRWSALVNEIPEGSGSINQIMGAMGSFSVVSTNNAFALAYPSNTPISLPDQGKVNFSLVAAEAYTQNQGQFSPAQVKNGVLEMDFGKSTFNTQLSVVTSPDNTEKIQAQGEVDRYGRMRSTSGLSNANVNGIVLNKGLEATYLFDKTLNSGASLSGAAQWGR
jgi:FecR protein